MQEVSPRNRNKGIVRLRVADVEDAPWNPRVHPQSQESALVGAINELGFYSYPDIYETNGTYRFVDGHLRKKVLLDHYGPEAVIDFNLVDFDESEAKKATLTKDPIAAMAQQDAAASSLSLN